MISLTFDCFLRKLKLFSNFFDLVQIEIEDLHEVSLYPQLIFSESVVIAEIHGVTNRNMLEVVLVLALLRNDSYVSMVF